MPIQKVPPLVHCDEWQTLQIMEWWEEEKISPAVSMFLELAWVRDKIYTRLSTEQLINTYYEKYFK